MERPGKMGHRYRCEDKVRLTLNAPLILVDGYQRSMDELTSEEIESVSVLKDAVATALYGIRGANGVILVKTKRGSVNEPADQLFLRIQYGYPQPFT